MNILLILMCVILLIYMNNNTVNTSKKENLSLNDKTIGLIQKLYKSDIRSMINFMQTNQNITNNQFNIIQEDIWETEFEKIKKREKVHDINNYISNVSELYNINKKNIIKDFFNYIIRYKNDILSCEFLSFIENIMHFEDCNMKYFINYTISQLYHFIPELL